MTAWWIPVVYFGLPAAAAVAVWRKTARILFSAGYYVMSVAVPALFTWAILRSFVLTERSTDIVGMGAVFFALLFAAGVWFSLVVCGIIFAFSKHR